MGCCGNGGEIDMIWEQVYFVENFVIDLYMFVVFVCVVDGVFFSVIVGEIVVVVGESGLGKIVMMFGLFGFLLEGIVIDMCGMVIIEGNNFFSMMMWQFFVFWG